MSSSRRLPRPTGWGAARAVLVAAGAVAALLVTAAPAQALSATAQLGRLPSRMNAGGPAATLQTAITNTSREETLTGVQAIFTITLDRAQPGQIQFSGGNLQVSEENGRLRAVQNIGFILPRRTYPAAYQLQFAAGAPSGRVTVTLEVLARDGGEQRRVARDTVTTAVQGLRGTPTPTATEAPLPTEGSVAPPTLATFAAPAGGDGADESDSGLWPLYLMGTMLVVGGGGFLGWLLLRRPRPALVEGAGESGYADGPALYGSGPYGGARPYGGGPAPGGVAPAGPPLGGGPLYPSRPAAYGTPTPYTAPADDHPTAIFPKIDPSDPWNDAPTTAVPPAPDPTDGSPGAGRHRG